MTTHGLVFFRLSDQDLLDIHHTELPFPVFHLRIKSVIDYKGVFLSFVHELKGFIPPFPRFFDRLYQQGIALNFQLCLLVETALSSIALGILMPFELPTDMIPTFIKHLSFLLCNYIVITE